MSDSIDKEISELYRQASRDTPPAHLDDAILALAKREAGAKPKAVSPFGGQWTLPFSLAAVIVLSVSVITLVEKEAPPNATDSLEAFSPPQESAAQPAVKNEASVEENLPPPPAAIDKSNKQSAPLDKRAQPSPLLGTSEPVPSRKELSDEKVLTEEKAAPKTRLTKPSVAVPSAPASSAPVSPEPPPGAITQGANAEMKAYPMKPEADDTVKERRKSRPAMSGLAAREPRLQEQNLSESSPAASADVGAATMAAPSAARLAAVPPRHQRHCEDLTAGQCLRSPQCIYGERLAVGSAAIEGQTVNKSPAAEGPAGRTYLCREAANRCEQGFIQWDAGDKNSGKTRCESKAGCRFIPGDCQCPDDQDCDCQGKLPPQCAEK
jgi:hypothetical protein